MTEVARSHDGLSLAGARVALAGRLSGMSRREAQQLVREHGGVLLDRPDASVNLLVMGDQFAIGGEAASVAIGRRSDFDEPLRAAIQQGHVQVVGETELWRRLGLVDTEPDIQRLYTPAMLAGLLKVELAIVRRWQRRGLIRPVRRVRRLPYFDFSQVLVARQLAGMLSAGVSPTTLERHWIEWNRSPKREAGRIEFTVVAGSRHILRRDGNNLLEVNGQRWFAFVDPHLNRPSTVELCGEAIPSLADDEQNHILPLPSSEPCHDSPSADVLIEMAEKLEDEGELMAAADMYRAALAAGGASADTCFALAELLYRLGDLSAARERYCMAIELNEDYVEARANLGCLLAEQGQLALAVAALEGALRYHADYADAHYHLAKTLHELGRQQEALPHWKAFLDLAPDNPWAAEVRLLLALAQEDTDDSP